MRGPTLKQIEALQEIAEALRRRAFDLKAELALRRHREDLARGNWQSDRYEEDALDLLSTER